MLVGLGIRDIVLIGRLDLELQSGLTVLTGETGAGKSIVLDALGLALGARADRGLVRTGAPQGSVTAIFDLPSGHPLHELLGAQEIEVDGELVLRRTLTADGRSRAFVNDSPVGTTLLREVGQQLIEVHGQMDQQGLLDAAGHRALLDEAGELVGLAEETRRRFMHWREIERDVALRRQTIEQARRDEAYLRHRLAELEELAPEGDEEEALAVERQRLMGREKLAELLDESTELLGGVGGAVERMGQVQRRLDRSAQDTRLAPAIQALDRALIEADEAMRQIDHLRADLDHGESRLAEVEERLFALRDAARKHRVAVSDLPELLERTRRELAEIDAGSDGLVVAERRSAEAHRAFLEMAGALSPARQSAAAMLEKAVMLELPPLRLEKTRFAVRLEPLAEPGIDGAERVSFEVSTNPGQPLGPLARIASGGELSRLMLALKVVLARDEEGKTLIFDEVDAGIGGATANAVGERLARLGDGRQVIVVTHAPQVAARADHHLVVTKSSDDQATEVVVRPLDMRERRDEVARMLAGAEITEAARAAAESLMAMGARAE